jgi:hypothetical protein
MNEEFGKITINYEGSSQNDELMIISKRNIYRIRK